MLCVYCCVQTNHSPKSVGPVWFRKIGTYSAEQVKTSAYIAVVRNVRPGLDCETTEVEFVLLVLEECGRRGAVGANGITTAVVPSDKSVSIAMLSE